MRPQTIELLRKRKRRLNDPGELWARDVLAGNTPANKLIIQMIERDRRDRKRIGDDDFPYKWSQDHIDHFFEFAALVRHVTGKWQGRPFEPLPWQRWVFSRIMGWVHRKTLCRRFRTALIMVARKNGKSFLAGVTALYCLLEDQEPSPEVYLLADSMRQLEDSLGRAIWKMVKENRVLSNEYLLEAFGSARKPGDIVCEDGRIRPVPAVKGGGLDGSNPSCIVADEIHSYSDFGAYESLESGQGARDNPLILAITTAGTNTEGPGFDMYSLGKAILRQETQDDTMFAALFGIDADDAISDETAWRKANPSWDLLNKDQLRSEFRKSRNSQKSETTFITKRLNMFSKGSGAWLTQIDLDHGETQLPSWEELKGEPVHIGIDLSMRGDLTCISYVFDGPDNSLFVKTRAFLPADRIKDNDLFTSWAKQGHLESTGSGEVVNHQYLHDQLLKDKEAYDVKLVTYDVWQASQLAARLEKDGFTLLQIKTNTNCSESLGNLSNMWLNGKVRYDSPVARWCFANCVITTDRNENIKLEKQSADDKIDAAVACLYAVHGKWAVPAASPVKFEVYA